LPSAKKNAEAKKTSRLPAIRPLSPAGVRQPFLKAHLSSDFKKMFPLGALGVLSDQRERAVQNYV
jgi:hypothetical protein